MVPSADGTTWQHSVPTLYAQPTLLIKVKPRQSGIRKLVIIILKEWPKSLAQVAEYDADYRVHINIYHSIFHTYNLLKFSNNFCLIKQHKDLISLSLTIFYTILIPLLSGKYRIPESLRTKETWLFIMPVCKNWRSNYIIRLVLCSYVLHKGYKLVFLSLKNHW